jgi:phage baseplate assembly protein W
MADINRETGEVISGWDEVAQSLVMCITTAIGERPFRRRFGRRDADMLDRPTNQFGLVDGIMSIVEAIRPHEVGGFQYGEPRFDLVRVIPSGDGNGNIQYDLAGIYMPGALRGDFTPASPQLFRLPTGVLLAGESPLPLSGS